MSLAVMSLVWQHFQGQGSELLLALALADVCGDDQGTMIFPSVSTLAAKTRQSTRTVQRQLRAFEKAGWLVPVGSAPGRGKTRRYRISAEFMALPDPRRKGDRLSPFSNGKGDTAVSRKGDTAVSPEPVVTQKANPSWKDQYQCGCGAEGVIGVGRRWLCRLCARSEAK